MIKQQLHSLHDLQELLCTELRLTTLYQALVELKDDSAFNDLPFFWADVSGSHSL